MSEARQGEATVGTEDNVGQVLLGIGKGLHERGTAQRLDEGAMLCMGLFVVMGHFSPNVRILAELLGENFKVRGINENADHLTDAAVINRFNPSTGILPLKLTSARTVRGHCPQPMTTRVSFLNGDLVEYPVATTREDLIRLIAEDRKVEPSQIQCVANEEEERETDYFVLINERMDYPFASWTGFFAAWMAKMKAREGYDPEQQTAYEEGFPAYYAHMQMASAYYPQLWGQQADLMIVSHLITTEGAQAGVDAFVEAMLKPHLHFSHYEDYTSYMHAMMELFKKEGVQTEAHIQRILTPVYSSHDDFRKEMSGDEEEEECVIRIKGMLLYLLEEKHPTYEEEFDSIWYPKHMVYEKKVDGIPQWGFLRPEYEYRTGFLAFLSHARHTYAIYSLCQDDRWGQLSDDEEE